MVTRTPRDTNSQTPLFFFFLLETLGTNIRTMDLLDFDYDSPNATLGNRLFNYDTLETSSIALSSDAPINPTPQSSQPFSECSIPATIPPPRTGDGVTRVDDGSGDRFRFTARLMGLTYPQATRIESRDSLIAHLKQVLPLFNRYCCAREEHEDGNQHFHVLIIFDKKVNLKNPRVADCAGHHPFIMTVRSEKAWHQYLHKEDPTPLCCMATIWQRVLNAGNTSDALSILVQEQPREVVMRHNDIVSNLNSYFGNAGKTYDAMPYQTWNLPAHLEEAYEQWKHESLEAGPNQRWKLLVLCGPSRIGKTCWARSLGQHAWVSSQWSLDQYSAKAPYVVFDDVPWKLIPQTKALFTNTGYGEIICTDKYRPKQTLKTKPAILCLNEEDWDSEMDTPYWRSNMIIVRLSHPLF